MVPALRGPGWSISPVIIRARPTGFKCHARMMEKGVNACVHRNLTSSPAGGRRLAVGSGDLQAHRQLQAVGFEQGPGRPGPCGSGRWPRPGRRRARPSARTAPATISRSWVAMSLVLGSDLDQGQEPATTPGVEVGRRLVQGQDRGVAGQDPRQADPLPLAEAEVMRRPGRPGVDQVDPGQAVEIAIRRASAFFIPRLSGPNATSSSTEVLKSWSSGSWNRTPTRLRTSGAFFGLTSRPSIQIDGPVPGDRGPLVVAVRVDHPGPPGLCRGGCR